jgi:UDP-glucose 4-epimerase
VFLTAVKTLDEKWKDGVLPYKRKPLHEHIIKTMQSKTFWYDYIYKYFRKIGAHPDMVVWLENSDDALLNLEVWGVENKSYSFGDLDKYLKSG